MVRVGPRRFLRARGQLPHAVGRLLHAGEPRGDDAALPRSLCAPPHRAGLALSRGAARHAALGRAAPIARASRSIVAADARRRTTAPITSIPSSPTRWASSWSRAPISSSTTTSSIMRTTEGLKRVDVIYRRIDDDYLDPLTFRPDSLLGTPGLFNAYRAGNVTLANAVGAGIADDKSIYPYRARDDPLLSRRGADPAQRADLSLRPSPTISPMCSIISTSWWSRRRTARAATACWSGRMRARAEREAFAAKLAARPADYIAQPTLALSTCPTFVDSGRRAAPCRSAALRAARARRSASCRAG